MYVIYRLYVLKGLIMSKLSSYFIDHMGYDISLTRGHREMTVVTSSEIYHHYNGLMLVVVF